MSSAFAKGALSGGTWSIAGNARSIKAAATGSDWSATVNGTLSTLAITGGWAGNALTAGNIGTFVVKGAMTGGSVTTMAAPEALVGGRIPGIRAMVVTGGIGSGATIVSASNVGSVVVKGDMINSTLRATGSLASLGRYAGLRVVKVTGTLADSVVDVAGPIGSVVTGAMTGSRVFAGVTPTVTTLAIFLNSAFIGSSNKIAREMDDSSPDSDVRGRYALCFECRL